MLFPKNNAVGRGPHRGRKPVALRSLIYQGPHFRIIRIHSVFSDYVSLMASEPCTHVRWGNTVEDGWAVVEL